MGCTNSKEPKGPDPFVSASDTSVGPIPEMIRPTPQNPPSVARNERFYDHYTISEKLGEGAFSKVMKGRKIYGGGEYAIKICSKTKLTPEDLDGLKKEIKILQLVRCEHIIGLYDVFEDSAYFYLVTELMQGGELFDRIVTKEFYLETDARNVCRSLFNAIAHCHSHNVAHRDLKPENLLLNSMVNDSDVKVADFGFATIAKNEHCLRTQCGTPGYVAPEILRGIPYGTKVDCWSLGVITYVLLGGYPPFVDQDKPKLFQKICAGVFEFHDQYWRQVSDDAKKFIRRLLTVNPGDRMTAQEALNHDWLTRDDSLFNSGHLSENFDRMKRFNAKRKLRAAVYTVLALNKFTSLGIQLQEELRFRNMNDGW